MSPHLTGETVEIVGINSDTNGHSCEEHHTCGCVLAEDTLIRLRKHQVYINGHEQSAVGVYWVSDGVDQCLVGFLHCHQVKHLKNWKELSVKLQRCTLTTLTALRSATNTRRTLVVQLGLLYQVMNPTKLRKQKTNYKVLPKLLRMWIHIQTPI